MLALVQKKQRQENEQNYNQVACSVPTSEAHAGCECMY